MVVLSSGLTPAADTDALARTLGLGCAQGGFFLDVAYKHGLDKNYAEVYSGSDLAKYEITIVWDHFTGLELSQRQLFQIVVVESGCRFQVVIGPPG